MPEDLATERCLDEAERPLRNTSAPHRRVRRTPSRRAATAKEIGRIGLRISRSAVLFVLPVLSSGVAFGGKADAPDSKVEDWFDFKFQGRKVGFLRSEQETTSVDGLPAIHVRLWSVITVKRQEQVIRMESTTDAWSDPAGRPIRFEHVRLEGREQRRSEGVREGKEIVVRSDVGGNQRERRIPLADDVFLATALDSVFNRDLRVGKAMTGRALIEEESELREFTIKVTGVEKTDRGNAFVIEASIGGIDHREIVLTSGRTSRVEIPALGAEFVSTTREKALVLEDPVDIFSAALFPVPRALPSGNDLDELVVHLSGKSGKAPIHIADGRQRATRLGKRTIELRIRIDPEPRNAPKLPVTASSVKKFLQETPHEALKDARLVAAAREAVGDERNAWAAARRINAFVHRHIKDKTLARAFATANEALASREGDCTEHSVLFSALAKIVGIPTRLATGLVFVGGKSNVFGYHEWVEVWMGDRWIAMDPTFGQDLADPTHIKFTQGLSDPDGLREAGIAAATLIGDLDLEVIEYTTSEGVRRKVE